MSDGNPTAGPSNTGEGSSVPKAIGSLAKKQADVTRSGTQKLKFVPTIPARRKKETEVKQEEAAPKPLASERGRGRGRGRGEGRGAPRGGARGGAPRAPPTVEMTASGPFAMGPALAGSSARRTAPRSNFAPVPHGPAGASALGAGLSKSAPPTLKAEKGKQAAGEGGVDDDVEVYSEPDEGVEIVDMEDIRQMDWMAPESLKKEKPDAKKKKKDAKVKHEEKRLDAKGKDKVKNEEMEVEADAEAEGEVDLANAVDLSESEEEEELEDIIEDFALEAESIEDVDVRQERLYFFQFPTPFPTLLPNTPAGSEEVPMDVDAKGKGKAPEGSDEKQKRVSFTPDTKPPVPGASASPAQAKEDPKLDGVIGQLEVYKSGAVKMRLGNGIVMDVTAATQPSFLQHAVYLDMQKKRLCVLGEVNKRFNVSPNIEALLEAMEKPISTGLDGVDDLIKMDTDT
ncbi:hypothetical protein JAAARDRAFT_31006 [Jaapia argillacea MUCL 33604]|uniref:DNA-directed RNA polymerase III subunit RPC4 n=1 Tax=Jaapia argillacea MUCL 33604 TaxID=933084 RepID=A0A067QDI2_9AGAM|nr:hypothetical protein JAAARDRAFT_31006 [Jaapia argillacea MUCL 33604]